MIRMMVGWTGIEVAEEPLHQFTIALVAFGPVALNLLSYFSKISIAGFEPAMISGLIGVLGAASSALGVPIPAEVLAAAGASTGALVASALELSSAISTNKIQPAGSLASPNP